MIAKFPDRSGMAGLRATGARIHTEQRKAASGETRQPVFPLLIQAEQASLFEARKRHWRRDRVFGAAPQFARLRAANRALAKALQKAVNCHQHI
jgi:hypothetical protein